MALKVFDLQCEHGHVFEGWFGSHDDYDAQQARGLVSCPICSSATITKRLSAPHLNVGHLREPQRESKQNSLQTSGMHTGGMSLAAGSDAEKMAKLQAAVLQHVRQFVRNSENVGPRFAEEARRIHEGEADDRSIRGTATPEERVALAEDGIDVVAVPDFLDDDRLQ